MNVRPPELEPRNRTSWQGLAAWAGFQGLLVCLTVGSLSGAVGPYLLGTRDSSDSPMNSIAWGAVALLASCLFGFRIRKRKQLTWILERASDQERALAEVHSRLHELSSFFDSALGLNLSMPLPELMEVVSQRLAASFRAQHVSIMFLEPSGQELRTFSSYGVESQFAREARVAIGGGVAGLVARDREPRLINGRLESRSDSPEATGWRNISSAICAPILHGDRVFGVLNVNRIQFPENFEQDHLRILAAFGSQLGGVIAQVQSKQRAEVRARELEHELQLANEKIGEIDRIRDLFLATAGHEFRTPLTVLKGSLDLLLDLGPAGMTEEQHQSIMQEMLEACDRLNSLVSDVIDLSNLERGTVTLHLQETDLSALARSSVEWLRPVAARHGITLREEYSDELPRIQADGLKLRPHLVQLLAIVLQITEAGGSVEIRTRSTGSHVLLEARSFTPIEIPDMERALAMFGQSHLRTGKSVSGFGVGVHLVKAIVELHGGNLTLRAAPEGGLLAALSLPLLTDYLGVVSDAA